MVYVVEFQAWVPFSLDRVFLFFANPENLPRIMPPSTRTRIEALRLSPPPVRSIPRDKIAGLDSEIETSFRVLPGLPFRQRWLSRITEFEWNDHFVDVQVSGPFRHWLHRHQVTSETQAGNPGTRVRDRIEYEFGFGGALAQLWISHQLKVTFGYRAKILESALRANL